MVANPKAIKLPRNKLIPIGQQVGIDLLNKYMKR